ncbi:hypothetical protein OK074_5056 [Actinobacteria bacterium OK074]|nr:hypothetical protein OK074_5056 [Actinobacteria bacterium OK074]
MGKRGRRREREATGGKRAKTPQLVFTDLPDSTQPRLRLALKQASSAKARELCHRYWSLDSEGRWTHHVGELGHTTQIETAVANVSHVLLLTHVCSVCGEPTQVTTRRQARLLAGPRLDRRPAGYRCPPCRTAQADELKQRNEALRAEQEEAQQRAEREQQLLTQRIADFREQEDEREPDPDPQVQDIGAAAVVVLTAMLQHAHAHPMGPIPSFEQLGPGTWTGFPEEDLHAVKELYARNLLAVHPSAPAAGTMRGQNGEIGYAAQLASWRLIGGTTHTQAVVDKARKYLQLAPGEAAATARQALSTLIRRMEVTDMVTYFNEQLIAEYRYPEVPPARAHELATLIERGFEQGFTTGQMICLVWRAADSASSWKERKGLGPGEASSAAVTTLEGKILDAIGRRQPVPEYDARPWHLPLPALAPGRDLHTRVARVRDRSLIAQCGKCDEMGFIDTEEADGRMVLIRCLHPTDILPSPRSFPDETTGPEAT